MHFTIYKIVFTVMPTVCFGVVVARNLDNSGRQSKIISLLNEAIGTAQAKFAGIKTNRHYLGCKINSVEIK